MRPSIVLLVAWMAPVVATAAPGDRGRAVRAALEVASWPAPGTSAWDARVAASWLETHDADGSGALEAEELEALACVELGAVDAGVRRRWGSGLWAVYGVGPQGRSVVGQLGVAETSREALAARLRSCGLDGERFGPVEAQDVAVRLLALPGGGDAAWDASVRHVLVGAHDRDEDGILTSAGEIGAIGCDAWHVLDARVRSRWSQGLYMTYGMAEGLVWVGDAIGLAAEARDAVEDAMVVCDVPGAGAAAPLPVNAEEIGVVVGLLPEPGSEAWTQLVRALLLHVYDADRSGDLAATGEVRAIDCGVWRALDVALASKGGIVERYGFGADAAWSGWRLGFEGSARAMAADAIGACLALKQADVPVQPRSPPTLATWDRDGSGRIDRAREVRDVPCEAWQSWAVQVRQERTLSLADAWGVREGMVWAAEDAGVDEAVRKPLWRALRRCGVDGD